LVAIQARFGTSVKIAPSHNIFSRGWLHMDAKLAKKLWHACTFLFSAQCTLLLAVMPSTSPGPPDRQIFLLIPDIFLTGRHERLAQGNVA